MAQTKITQTTIARLEATGKRQFIRDADLTGFGIEGSAKGKFSYIVETRIRGSGKNVRTRLGNVDHLPLDEARQEARKLLLEAGRGKDIRFHADEEEALPETLQAAHEDFTKAKKHTLASSTLSDYQKTFQNCLSNWRTLPVAQLSRRMVKDRYLELLESKSPAYANKVFRNLSAVLGFHGVTPNPVAILKDKSLRPKTQGRSRFLSASEIKTVWLYHTTFKPKITRILLFYMLTGVRRNEALALTWGDIQDGKARITNTKNGKAHFIPLVGVLEDLVGKRQADGEHVFGYTDARLRTALASFQSKPEVRDDWTIHDLRRTFSEHMNLIGYTETDIAVANNQTSTSVTRSSYLQGELAKEALLIRMFKDLQGQHEYYYREDKPEVQKVPEDWMPEDMRVELEIGDQMRKQKR